MPEASPNYIRCVIPAKAGIQKPANPKIPSILCIHVKKAPKVERCPLTPAR